MCWSMRIWSCDVENKVWCYFVFEVLGGSYFFSYLINGEIGCGGGGFYIV